MIKRKKSHNNYNRYDCFFLFKKILKFYFSNSFLNFHLLKTLYITKSFAHKLGQLESP
jgi:hypothetical protein